eukprot:2531676-Pleurochrysis_carterae.AAC.1
MVLPSCRRLSRRPEASGWPPPCTVAPRSLLLDLAASKFLIHELVTSILYNTYPVVGMRVHKKDGYASYHTGL